MVDDAEAEAIRNEVPVERVLTNTHRHISFTVGRLHGKGWRLDKYLSAIMPTISRAMIQRWIERGAATIDGQVALGRPPLRPGQKIVLLAPLPERGPEQNYPQALEILYQDTWLLAINKPPGQLAHQAGKTMTGTVLNQVQEWYEAQGHDPQQVRLINRIDRDTSGILLLSLDLKAHGIVAQAMEARDLDKEYRAICHHRPRDEHGDWRDPIGEGPASSIARVVRDDGQPCHTEFFVLESTAQNDFSLLRLLLHTGRQHQIRVHAAHNGCPLVGDWVYGTACQELSGQALHAALMEFAHPFEKRSVRIEAPLPTRLQQLWQQLLSGTPPTPLPLSEEQRSKLGLVDDDSGIKRPSWLSAEEFAQLRRETGE
jgi:23S rRNA pseudouridine1911/1915/1917 synthase